MPICVYIRVLICIGYKEYSSTPVLQTLARFLVKAVIDIFFSFLGNQVKLLLPGVVKPQNLIFGVTLGWNLSMTFTSCLCFQLLHSSLFDLSALPGPFWLLTLHPLLFVTFFFLASKPGLSLLLFCQTCLSLFKFSLFSGILSALLPPGLFLHCSCSLPFQRLLFLFLSPLSWI